MSARVRSASLTTLLNALLAGTRFVISILTVSMLIRYLGQTLYGLCITITAMAGWLSVTQAGLGQSFRNEAIRLRATGAHDRLSGVFSSAFVFLAGMALVVGTLLTAIARWLPWNAILNAAAFQSDPRGLCLILASIWIVLLTVPLGLVRAAYSAFQMEFKLAAPLLAGLIISFSFVALGIHRDWGLVPVVSAALAGPPAGLALGMALMPRMISSRFSWRAVDVNVLRNLRGPSIWFLIIEVAALFIFQADIFLVNLTLGPNHAASYGMHLQLFFYVQSAAFLFVSPYWPVLAEAWQLGEMEWFHDRVQRLTKTTAILAGCVAGGLILAGPFLMHRWSHGQTIWNPLLAAMMGANVLLQAVTGVSATALGSLGVARDPALLIVFQAILNVSVCYWLIHLFGIVGCAAGSLAAYAITSGWYIPWRLRRIGRLCLAPI